MAFVLFGVNGCDFVTCLMIEFGLWPRCSETACAVPFSDIFCVHHGGSQTQVNNVYNIKYVAL